MNNYKDCLNATMCSPGDDSYSSYWAELEYAVIVAPRICSEEYAASLSRFAFNSVKFALIVGLLQTLPE